MGTSFAKPVAPTTKVGVLLSSSGPLWFTSAIEKTAVQLAVDDLRDLNSENISLVFDDAGDTDQEAKAAMQRFRSSGVDAILAPLDTDSAVRIAKYNQENPVPIIAPSSLEENVSSPIQGKNWFFRLASTTTQDASTLAKYIAKTKPGLVLIATDQDDYSRLVSRMVNLGLVFRGIRVQQYGITEYKKIRQTKPDAFVLVSLESSIDFFQSMNDWVSDLNQGYLVAGNLANYSTYTWAKSLTGFKALSATDNVPASFKNRMALAVNRPALVKGSNSNLFGLAYRSYQAITTIYQAAQESKDLRSGIAGSKNDSAANFDGAGYFLGQGYAIFRYGNTGTYSQVGYLAPNSP